MDTVVELRKALHRHQLYRRRTIMNLHVIGGTALVGYVDIMVARLYYSD